MGATEEAAAVKEEVEAVADLSWDFDQCHQYLYHRLHRHHHSHQWLGEMEVVISMTILLDRQPLSSGMRRSHRKECTA